jgi:hypothetical protein
VADPNAPKLGLALRFPVGESNTFEVRSSKRLTAREWAKVRAVLDLFEEEIVETVAPPPRGEGEG